MYFSLSPVLSSFRAFSELLPLCLLWLITPNLSFSTLPLSQPFSLGWDVSSSRKSLTGQCWVQYLSIILTCLLFSCLIELTIPLADQFHDGRYLVPIHSRGHTQAQRKFYLNAWMELGLLNDFIAFCSDEVTETEGNDSLLLIPAKYSANAFHMHSLIFMFLFPFCKWKNELKLPLSNTDFNECPLQSVRIPGASSFYPTQAPCCLKSRGKKKI